MRLRRWASWLLALAGTMLAVTLFLFAEPTSVLRLAAQANLSGLLVAFAWTLALLVLRGLRLGLLVGGRLSPGKATAVTAVSQLAVGVLPMRLGELALIPLLTAAGMPGALRGLSFLVLVRALDVAALLVWGVLTATVLGRSAVIAGAALLLLLALLGGVCFGGARLLRELVTRWRRRTGWRHRALRQLLQVRGELCHLARSPLRAGGSAVASLLVWGAIWGVSVSLLRAMHLDWPSPSVLFGVIGAAIASSLPVNSIGSFGTQEAGWAAALSSVGVAPQIALAAGFASHLWSVAFSAILGALGAAYLAARRSDSSSSTLRASVKNFLTSLRGV